MRTDEKSKFGEFDVRDLVFVGRNLDPRYFRKIYSIEFKPGSAMAKFAFSVGRLRRDVFKNREWTLVSGCPVPTRLDDDGESLTPDSQRLIRNMFSKCLINPDKVKDAVAEECERIALEAVSEKNRLAAKAASLKAKAEKLMAEAESLRGQAETVSAMASDDFIKAESEKADLALNIDGK